MRIPIMAGNWKMNCDNTEAAQLAKGIVKAATGIEGCQVVLCPPFTALTIVNEIITDTVRCTRRELHHRIAVGIWRQ